MRRTLDPDVKIVGWWPWTGVVCAVAAAYLAFAVISDHYFTYPGSVTAIWPASGIGVAAVIVFGYRALLGIGLGVYLNQIGWMLRDPIGPDPWAQWLLQSEVGLSYAVGNVLEAALILYAVRRINGPGNPLLGAANVVRFIFIAALLGPLVGTINGAVVTIALWQWAPWSALWSTLWTWWVSVVGGVLMVAPPLLFLHHEWASPWRTALARLPESLLLLACTVAVVALTFYWSYPFEYLLLPILLWSAFRYGQAATAWLSGAMMLVVVVATTRGFGPFAVDPSPLPDTIQSLTLLQCFTAALITTAMIVSALLAERRRIADALRESNATLEERVAERTRELSLARRAAEDADRAKSRFLTNMSHELRTPLNAVLGLSRLAFRQLETLVPDSRDNLSIVDRNGERLLELIDDVLKMARLKSGELPARVAPFEPARLFRDVGDAVDVQAMEKGLTLTMHVDERLPRRLEADAQRLGHVLINLVSNAIKFTDRGGIAVRMQDASEAHGDVEATRRRVRFSVEDSGVGIPRERLATVFEPFQQLDAARDSARGSGLGLAIAREFVESMGGRLRASSTPGRGSTFHFAIDCGVVAEDGPGRRVEPDAEDDRPADDRPALAPSTRARPTVAVPPAAPRQERLLAALARRDVRWRDALAEAARRGDTRAALDLVGTGSDALDELDAWIIERARRYELPAVVELLGRLPARRRRAARADGDAVRGEIT